MYKYLLLLLILSTTSYPQQKYFQIEKNHQGGFNIFSNSGELLYKYTKMNTDSLSLSTLDDIFFTADSFVSDEPTKIEIVNLPEGTWWDDLMPIFSVIIGVFFGWLFSFFSQKTLTKQQSNIRRKENWLNDFINLTADVSSVSNYYCSEMFRRIREEFGKGEKISLISDDSFLSLSSELSRGTSKIQLQLDKNNESEKLLHELIEEHKTAMIDIAKMKNIGTIVAIESTEKQISELDIKIHNQMQIITKHKQNELRSM